MDHETRRCRVCGCTEERGCVLALLSPHPYLLTELATCWWVADDLCSACGGPDQVIRWVGRRRVPIVKAATSLSEKLGRALAGLDGTPLKKKRQVAASR